MAAGDRQASHPYGGHYIRDENLLKESLQSQLYQGSFTGNSLRLHGSAGYCQVQQDIRGVFGSENMSSIAYGQDQYLEEENTGYPVRISVEWGFGEIINEWAMLDFKRKMTLGTVPVGLLYEVVAIFANCVTIARHQNVLSSYFDVVPPTFQKYFAGLTTFSMQSSDKTN